MRKDIDFDLFRKMLEAQRVNIQQQVEQEMILIQTYSDSTPDFLDAATKTISQGRRMGWINYLRGRKSQLEEAIRRLETGQFGICANCGKDIEVDRLKVKPYARYCIRCKEKQEQKGH